jgi:hypothetical protein
VLTQPSSNYFSGVTLRDRLRLDVGMIESVKWLAAFLMLVDHVNRYVLEDQNIWFYYVGRLVYPLFAVALGVSMCGRDQSSMGRAFKRTVMWAILAQVASWLVRDPAPWNILFVLAAGLLIVSQIERRSWWVVASIFLALIACPFAEYSVAGVFVAVSGIYFGRHQSAGTLAAFVFSVAFLQVENGIPFALLSFPVLALLAWWRIEIPRIRNSMQFIYVAQFPLLALAKVFT